MSNMDSTIKNKPMRQALTMAELLPSISGICSSRSCITKNQPRNTMAETQTAVKAIRPMTIAEMQANNILVFKDKTPKKLVQSASASNKKKWNSSVKIENKFKRVTANEQLKNNPVKKALNFQVKPKPPVYPRKTIIYPENSIIKTKKALPQVRISGICKIAETPATTRKSRVTIANKENNSILSNLPKKNPHITPKSILKKLKPPIPDTPISNISGDTSFLQREKEINDLEDKIKSVNIESALESSAEVSAPVSTPFKEYRNVQEFFTNSNNDLLNEDSALYIDNTITSFDNISTLKDNTKREESVIVSLCDMLNTVKVTNIDNTNSELKDLLESEKQIKENIKMIDNCNKFLTRIKESYIKHLQHIQKLKQEKQGENPNSCHNKIEQMEFDEKASPKKAEISRPCSVIKSPTYKIPKKNLCLRKKVFHKSMPNVSTVQSPTVLDSNNTIAHNIYMKMKENMNFLSTPLKQYNGIPDTPAITSRNLQNQLDKLYNGS